jgi:hypothetical protein
MSQLVKTKHQANFKDFKRFGAFKGLVEQKNVVFNSLVCQLGFFGPLVPKNPSLHKNSSNKLLLSGSYIIEEFFTNVTMISSELDKKNIVKFLTVMSQL